MSAVSGRFRPLKRELGAEDATADRSERARFRCAAFSGTRSRWSLVRDTLGRAAPDQLIAVTAELHGVIVVTFDKDFRRFQRSLPEGRRRGFVAGAGLIQLAMGETRGVARSREEIEVIEFYAARAALERKVVRIRLSETTIQCAMAGGRVRRQAE